MTLEKILVVGQTQESASALADFAAPLAANVEVVILGDARAEDCADAVSALVKELVPAAVLFASTKRMRYVAAIVAADAQTRVINDVTELSVEDAGALASKRISFGGKVDVRERVASGVAVATVSAAALSAARTDKVWEATQTAAPAAGVIGVVSTSVRETEAVDLCAAKRVVSIGRGLAAKEDLALIEGLASALEAEVGCTRPIAEGQAWLARERYIGVSGVMLSPDLFVAVGLSGQIQHMVGAAGAKTIIAINKDKSAPVFKQCDYGIIGDLYDVVPQLTAALKA